jgi:hypothetical protein
LCKLPSNVRDILKILLKRNKVRDNWCPLCKLDYIIIS